MYLCLFLTVNYCPKNVYRCRLSVQDASGSTSSTDDAEKTQQYEVCSGAWSAFFKWILASLKGNSLPFRITSVLCWMIEKAAKCFREWICNWACNVHRLFRGQNKYTEMPNAEEQIRVPGYTKMSTDLFQGHVMKYPNGISALCL